MTKRKTTQALKISATWTPKAAPPQAAAQAAFGLPAPLRIEGGRHRLVAAISIDAADPASVRRASERADELKTALAETGTVHSFITQFGTAPIETVHTLTGEQA